MTFKLSISEVQIILKALGQYEGKCSSAELAMEVIPQILSSSSKDEAMSISEKISQAHQDKHEQQVEQVLLLRAKMIGIRDKMHVEDVTT